MCASQKKVLRRDTEIKMTFFPVGVKPSLSFLFSLEIQTQNTPQAKCDFPALEAKKCQNIKKVHKKIGHIETKRARKMLPLSPPLLPNTPKQNNNKRKVLLQKKQLNSPALITALKALGPGLTSLSLPSPSQNSNMRLSTPSALRLLPF